MSESKYRFGNLVNKTYKSAQKIAPLITEVVGVPQVVVDLGGGGGGWLKAFQDLGTKEVYLIEHPSIEHEDLLISKENLILYDFECDKPSPIPCDLAISTELAEHIDHSKSEMIVDFLTQSAPIVLFSAAIPGQPGLGHVNSQRPCFWQDYFDKRNYKKYDFIRRKIIYDETIPYWFRQNLVLYVDRNIEKSFGLSSNETRFIPDEFEIVHTSILKREPGVRDLLERLPAALIKSVKKYIGVQRKLPMK